MKRSTLTILMLVAAVLLVPAAAEAKTVHGTVLSLDKRHHKTRLILPGHNVRAFRIKGRVGRKVAVGSRVAANAKGKTLRRLRPVGRARVLKFYGRVVRDNRSGLVLRLGDGEKLTLGGKKKSLKPGVTAAAASPFSLSIQGLQPGQTVLVTITLGSAGVESVAIKIMPAQDPAGDGSGDVVSGGDDGTIDDNNGDDYTVDGTVTAVDQTAGTLELDTSDGQHLVFTADPDTLDGISVGDDVEVDYAKDTSTGELIADCVYPVDNSGDTSGDNSGDASGDNSGDASGDNSGDSSSDGSGDTSTDTSSDTSSSSDSSSSHDITVDIEVILHFE